MRVLVLVAIFAFLKVEAQATTCDSGGDTYLSAIGLTFNIHCNTDLHGYDVAYTAGSSITDCAEQCSRRQILVNETGPCSAAVYDDARKTCFLKKGANSSATLNYVSSEVHTAIASEVELSTLNSTCQYPDKSIQTAVIGEQFQILCGMDIVGHDMPDNLPTSPDYWYYHAANLADCFNFCAEGRPLCYGVVYNPDMKLGYHNCWPKQENVSHYVAPSTRPKEVTTHVALAQLAYDETVCLNGRQYHDGYYYNVTCNYYVDGDTINLSHQPTLTACIEECEYYAGNNQPCKTVLYQPKSEDGYKNCYLKLPNTQSVPYSRMGWNYAVLASGSWRVAPGSFPTTSPNPFTTKSGIAGLIVAFLVLGVVLIVLCRCKKPRWRTMRNSTSLP